MKIKNVLVSQPAPVIAEKSPFHEIVLKHRVNVEFHPFIKLEGVSLKEFRSQRVDILRIRLLFSRAALRSIISFGFARKPALRFPKP